MKKLYVVTDVEAGWDCVTCVVMAENEEEVIDLMTKDGWTYNEDVHQILEIPDYKKINF